MINTFLIVTELSILSDFPKNAIIVTYSNHYKGNSGDDIYLTDDKKVLYKV